MSPQRNPPMMIRLVEGDRWWAFEGPEQQLQQIGIDQFQVSWHKKMIKMACEYLRYPPVAKRGNGKPKLSGD